MNSWVRLRQDGGRCPQCGGILYRSGGGLACNGYNCPHEETWTEHSARIRRRQTELVRQIREQETELIEVRQSTAAERERLATELVRNGERIMEISNAWEALRDAAQGSDPDELISKLERALSGPPSAVLK